MGRPFDVTSLDARMLEKVKTYVVCQFDMSNLFSKDNRMMLGGGNNVRRTTHDPYKAFSQTVVALRSDNRNKARSFRACTDASLRQLRSVKEKGLYVAEANKGSRRETIAVEAAWTARMAFERGDGPTQSE